MAAQVFDERLSERQREPVGTLASSTTPDAGCDFTDLKLLRGALYAVPIGTLLWVLIWGLIRLALYCL